MSILPIYLYGSEVLKKKAKPVTKVTDKHISQIMNMFETMHQAQGIGLAANQVGSLERIIVVDVSEVEGYEEVKPMALINPEIVGRDGSATMEEGCLSIPDVRDEVERAEGIIVRFRDTDFQQQEKEAHDLLARVIMHEIDHLNGVLFLDHLSATKRKLHKEQLDKIKQGEVETSYPVISTATVPA
ncbi:MAG: peptide deformylase [Ignavibacteriae bacterium]|nr:peptide deformylase [Ignavibacteriota bacterium]